MPAFSHRHLLSIDNLSAPDIQLILDEAQGWAAFNRGARKQDDRLAGLTQVKVRACLPQPSAARAQRPRSPSGRGWPCARARPSRAPDDTGGAHPRPPHGRTTHVRRAT